MRWNQRAVVAGVAALLLTAAACGSSSESDEETTSGGAAASTSSGGGFSVDSSASAAPATGDVLTRNPETDGKTINVLMVANPQMTDLQSLTAENFTAKTGITVNYTVLPENDMRAKADIEFKNQAGQYDVATLSNFEIPIWSQNGWLADLTEYSTNDAAFNQGDIFPAMTSSLSMDGKIYGEPFYGESSFLMYRTDVFEKAGVTLPDAPTWDEVAAAAEKVDGAESGMKGICLRGLPGWGQLGAPLTTVINTFGGAWFDADWNALLTDPKTVEAVNFYTTLVKEHGEVSPSQAGFTECLNNMLQSKVAMWYDATSAAGSLEADDSPVKGKVGYVQAPVKDTKSSGWLYTWSWAMEEASQNKDAAWQFISWASSAQYEQLVGEKLGWAKVPSGKRASLYSNPDYTAAAEAFAPATLTALQNADPQNPGLQPRPTVGIQFVDIPEFTSLGDEVTASLSQVLAGNGTVEDALAKAQESAQKVGDDYK
ncbi:extracellular solute-binding protein [Nakamurella sp. YIM 132087]|uniref:Extracellular solute-binding protein n=1 Tax=Nakamurella alba TaxID=2665158 RepID=A0A7K1FJW3_9ACTN|nr:sugar ABC transporter substrate-binding protein [Nakamurella alba]MTD14425.1 extracellular solute-binding protein [Nakamurella alba]